MSYSTKVERQIRDKQASINIIEYCLEQKVVQDDLTETEFVYLHRALNELKKNKRIKMGNLPMLLQEFDLCYKAVGRKLLSKFWLRLMVEAAARADIDTVELHGKRIFNLFQPEQQKIINKARAHEQEASSEYWRVKSKWEALKLQVGDEIRKLERLARHHMMEVGRFSLSPSPPSSPTKEEEGQQD